MLTTTVDTLVGILTYAQAYQTSLSPDCCTGSFDIKAPEFIHTSSPQMCGPICTSVSPTEADNHSDPTEADNQASVPQPESTSKETAPDAVEQGPADEDHNAFPIRCCRCRRSLQDCFCEWELCEGATVILCGLQKAQELNGQVALVERSASEDGRWSVRLQNGGGKRVRPENMRANPREIAEEMFTDVGATLTKLDGVLERLKSNASDAEASLTSIAEQKQTLDEMSSCPAEMLSKAAGLLSNAQSNLDNICNEIESVEAERTTVLGNGVQAVTQLVSKFMTHAAA